MGRVRVRNRAGSIDGRPRHRAGRGVPQAWREAKYSIIERWVQTCRYEMLDRTLI